MTTHKTTTKTDKKLTDQQTVLAQPKTENWENTYQI